MTTEPPLLDVRDLRVRLRTHAGPVDAVRGVSFTLQRGETLLATFQQRALGGQTLVPGQFAEAHEIALMTVEDVPYVVALVPALLAARQQRFAAPEAPPRPAPAAPPLELAVAGA